jgi:hypothetical protein
MSCVPALGLQASALFVHAMRAYVSRAGGLCHNTYRQTIRDAPSVGLGTFIITSATRGAMPFLMAAAENSVILVDPFKKAILPTLFAE